MKKGTFKFNKQIKQTNKLNIQYSTHFDLMNNKSM